MIFQYTWPQIVAQRKTSTRRVMSPCEKAVRGQYNKIIAVQHKDRVKWRIGATYAVQPGRGQQQIARIRLTRITQQKLHQVTYPEAQTEGFASRKAFLQAWETIHGNLENCRVWVLEFELVEITSELQNLSWRKLSDPIPAPIK